MASSRIEHINAYEFYMLYNTIRCHFQTELYDITKYGFFNKNISKKYSNDPLASLYNSIAKNFRTKEEAIPVIVGNMLQPGNKFITSFNVQAGKTLVKYQNNKNALLNDFQEEVRTADLIGRLKSGRLADQLYLENYKPELFGYVNNVMPLNKLAKEYSTNKSKGLTALLYGKASLIEKIAPFCQVTSMERDTLSTEFLSELFSQNQVIIHDSPGTPKSPKSLK